MSIWDILFIALVALIIFNCIRTIKKRRKNLGCGGGCAGCTMHNCPSRQINSENDLKNNK